MKKYTNRSCSVLTGAFVLSALLFLQMNLFSQQGKTIRNTNEFPPALEVAEGEYQPIERSSMPKSPAYKSKSVGFFMTQVNIDEDGNNIVGDASNEPSIAIDPTDPNRMAIGWRHFSTISNNFRQAGYAYTTDGGQTWTFPDVIDPGVFRSDPVLDTDSEGNFYYNSLTVSGGDNYYCDVYRSDDGGSTWDNGTFAQGGDKQWMTIDKSGGVGDGNIYAYWNQSYSTCDPGFFTRSVDEGSSYEPCLETNYLYWGTNTVDGDGNLYLSGINWNNFVVIKSSNAQISGVDISWDFAVDVDLDGTLKAGQGFSSPNPSGLLGQANIDVDRSGGEYDGNIYLLASVERSSNNDPCDIMFSRSTDGGFSWSFPYKVNDDLGTWNYQWFGTMSVAPTGRIDAVWLDTRDNPGDVNSALYYSYSLDAGETWLENVKLSESFDPHVGFPQQNKMGDYFHIISDETGAHLAWAGTFNGEQDVYYSYISMETTGISQNSNHAGFELMQNYPNPFKGQTNIRYHIAEAGFVSLKVIDVSGREVARLVNGNVPPGYHNVMFDASELKEGVYYYTITTGYGQVTKKLMLIK